MSIRSLALVVALAPLVAHATAGEWTRGLAFASVPTAALAGTGVVVALDSDAIDRGEKAARISVWSFLTAGLLSGVAGVVDATLADRRAHRAPLSVSPIVGSGQLGLALGGLL